MDQTSVELPTFERLLERLKHQLTASGPDALLAATVETLAWMGSATSAGLFITHRDEIVGEASWSAKDGPSGIRLAEHFKKIALEAARGRAPAEESATARSPAGALAPDGVPTNALAPDGDREAGTPRVFMHALDEERTLVACMIPREGPPHRPALSLISRVLELTAFRFADCEREARAAADAAQHQRWFRQFDGQIRVLDRERQKFAAVVSQSDMYVFVADANGTFRWTNRAMAQRFEPAEGATSWLGESCRTLCARFGDHLSQEPCGDCPLRRAIAEGKVVHRELHEPLGRDVRNLYLTALPILDPEGGALEVMVMIQDLSDLQSLRASETRYRLLFESSANAIVMADPVTQRIVLANPAACAMTGFTLRELLDRSLLELCAPASSWPRAAGESSGADGESMEYALLTRDGIERVVIAARARFELAGRELLMVEMRDITEHRRAERDLRQAEERLRTVISHSPIVLFAIDRHGRFTLSEGRGLEALGLKPGQVVGCSAFEIYAESPTVVESLRRALAGEEFTEVVQVGTLTYETCFTPILNASGGTDGVIGVATDVTLRQRLEEQLRHSQKMDAIGRLAGGVAHDFNNLLTAIMGHAQLLQLRLGHDDRFTTDVEEINKACSRGALLTRRLLAFGRKDLPAPRVLDLNCVVEGMEGMLRRLIGEDVELVTIPAAGPACVRADLSQIEQVIMNLAVNARDAMPRGGHLALRIENRDAAGSGGPDVVLEVSDTGCGMDTATLDHAFEPFFTTKEFGKGTGLGLAIVYGIVTQYRGEVQMESARGHGTTVRVVLPRAADAAEEVEPQSDGERTSRGFETILLVEDEDSVRDAVDESLTLNGYTVIGARDGIEALELRDRHASTIHIVVTDVVMPRMNGGELARRLRERDPDLRVLFVSGYADDAIVRDGVSEGSAPFLQKPFSLEILNRKVREVLDSTVASEPGSSQRRAA